MNEDTLFGLIIALIFVFVFLSRVVGSSKSHRNKHARTSTPETPPIPYLLNDYELYNNGNITDERSSTVTADLNFAAENEGQRVTPPAPPAVEKRTSPRAFSLPKDVLRQAIIWGEFLKRKF